MTEQISSKSESSSECILEISKLVTGFYINQSFLQAVDDCSLKVNKAKTIGIVGESGCGKSVLSLSIMRLISSSSGKIASGKIVFQGTDLLSLSEKKMCSVRGNKISMIFQEPMTSLNPVYTVGDQISEVFILHKNMSRKEARESSIKMLSQVRISSPEKRIDDYPHQLSGGMRQRVMIAMALACQPLLLIADEPTTALDVTIQAQILALMNELQEEQKMSIILITHDLGVVAETCDDVVVMYSGKIIESCSVKELFSDPKHPYSAGLLQSVPSISQMKKRLYTIPGLVPSLGQWPQGCRFQDRCPYVMDICRVEEPLLKSVSSSCSRMAACHKL